MPRRVWLVCFGLLVAGAAFAQGSIAPSVQKELDVIEAAVVEFRELEAIDAVSHEFRTREAAADRLKERFTIDYPPERIDRLYLFYRALDLAEPDLDLGSGLRDFMQSQVSGFYDVDKRSMVVIMPTEDVLEDGLAAPQKVTYAHEYAHALQDQHFNLSALAERRRQSDNFDYVWSLTALIEGGATLVSSYYLDELMSAEKQKTQREMERNSREAAALRWPAGLPRIIEEELRFAYIQGSEFAAAVTRELGWEGIETAFRNNLIVTSEQVLHPDRFLAGDGAIVIDPPDLSAVLDQDWRLAYDNAVGEFYLLQHLQTQLPPTYARTLALGWGGDRLQIFTDATGEEMIWAWHHVWDSAQDAEEFALGYRSFLNSRFGAPSADGHCWLGESTRCSVHYGEFETRITMAFDKASARALLALRG